MCSRCRSAAVALAGLLTALSVGVAGGNGTPAGGRVLRVCADPNNLPFSNAQEQGFENRLAGLIARGMDARLEHVWHAQRRGFIRNTLGAGTCDVVAGLPVGMEGVETTRPYYTSTHVFVTRARDRLDLRSLDDPRLQGLRIGVTVVGDDYASPPPLRALGARGLVRNVAGYSVFGNYAEPNPPARVVEAVARGDVDVAIVWGPLGGYFASRQPVPLQVHPVAPDVDRTGVGFTVPIGMGVRKGDVTRRQELQRLLDRHRTEVDALLRAYGVPLKPAHPRRGGA